MDTKKIRELADKATPRPWSEHYLGNLDFGDIKGSDDMVILTMIGIPNIDPSTNRRFIIEMANNILELLDENERLREALQQSQSAIESLPEESLGIVRGHTHWHWIKDELLQQIKEALDEK